MTNPTKIYVCVASGSGGVWAPTAWVARIVTPEGTAQELTGLNEGSLSRSQVVACTQALDALPEGSTATVLCTDMYLIRWVLDRLDALVAGKVKPKGKRVANTDLFPDLLRARDRHKEVRYGMAHEGPCDAEHALGMASVERLITGLQGSTGEARVFKARKVKPKAEVKAEPAITPIIERASNSADADVPW